MKGTATSRAALLAVLALALGGCASTGGGSGGSFGVLTREQLVETRQPDLLQAVQALRPQWLRARQASIEGWSYVQVFLNGAHYGTVDQLRNISIDAVVDVRYMSASEAAGRFGTVAGNAGTVLVRTAS